MRTRSIAALSIAALAALSPVGLLAAPASAGPTFSTSPQSAPDPHPHAETQFFGIRTANDGTFDRIVFDERFSPAGYHVTYVKHVTSDGSGNPVHVKGHYFLAVSFPNTSTSGAAGSPTNVPHKITPNLPELRQIKATGDFEDVISFGIGLRHKNGFRVNTLHNPIRTVIDIEH